MRITSRECKSCRDICYPKWPSSESRTSPNNRSSVQHSVPESRLLSVVRSQSSSTTCRTQSPRRSIPTRTTHLAVNGRAVASVFLASSTSGRRSPITTSDSLPASRSSSSSSSPSSDSNSSPVSFFSEYSQASSRSAQFSSGFAFRLQKGSFLSLFRFHFLPTRFRAFFSRRIFPK